ncbi:MAG: hypothetical protein KJ941_07035 [Bacteroidetes bacterium]|nr:hypothetical protein [Bacteroidota bacterium]
MQHQLRQDQVDFILNDIRKKGIEIEDLQYSLLDHICCVLEEGWDENETFSDQYLLVLPRLFKKELSEIQEETELLITFKHFYAMKKSMIYSGTFSAFALIFASIFKLMHWPGAAILIVLAIAFFSFVFLPLLFIIKAKEVQLVREKMTIGIGVTIGSIFCLSVLFKVMHWPGANFMGISSLLGLFFVFLPLHFFGGIRNEATKTNTIISSVLLVVAGGLMFSLINLRPSKRLEGAILETNKHMNNSILIGSAIQPENPTSEIALLSNSISLDIKKIKQDIATNLNISARFSDEEIIRSFGTDFRLTTALLFEANGRPKVALAKLKKDLLKLKGMLEGKKSSNLLQLNDRVLHAETPKNVVSWENEQFYMIPATLVLSNFNLLLMDLNTIRLGVN